MCYFILKSSCFIRADREYQRCIQANCPNDITNCYQEGVVRTVTNTYNDPSDGFICKYSQIIDGIPQDNIYEAMGVNHREETNTTEGLTLNGNDEMDDIFNLIWESRDQGDFFLTDER